MPISYEVDEEANFVYVSLTGDITEEALLQHSEQFLKDDRIKPGFREMYDATAALPLELPAECIQAILSLDETDPDKFSGSRTALVIPDWEGSELAKEYEKNARGTVILFFATDVALTWLAYDGPLAHTLKQH